MSDFIPDDLIDIDGIDLLDPIDLPVDVFVLDGGDLPDPFQPASPGGVAMVAAAAGLTNTAASLAERAAKLAKNLKAKGGRK